MARSARTGSSGKVGEKPGIRKRLKEGKFGKYRRAIERPNDADRDARMEEWKAAVREKVRAAAQEAADEVFGPAGMPWGTLFDDLETLAVAGGDLFSQAFMAQAAAQQATAALPEREVCPYCGEPLSDKRTDPRVLQTTRGDVTWAEPQRICTACGRSFFPSVSEFGTGPAIVQPAHASEDAVRGGDVGVPSSGSGVPSGTG
jgi:hypothetical protein